MAAPMTSPVSLLPPRARAKLARLTADVTDARALLNALGENVKVAEAAVMHATHAVEAADARDTAHYKRLFANLSSAEASRAAVERKRAARQAQLASSERQLQPILNWLEQFRFGPVGDREIWVDSTVAPQRQDDETYPQAVDRIRAEIYRIRAEISLIMAAPLPLEDIKASIVQQVAAMAASGAPSLEVVPGYGTVRIVWPGDRNRHQEMNLAHWAALAWMHPDFIKDYLTKQAEQQIGDRGIPYAERGPRISELERRIASLELAEAALIDAAEAEGVVIAHRSDANPAAILLMTWAPNDENSSSMTTSYRHAAELAPVA
jgi:hypothetical protein